MSRVSCFLSLPKNTVSCEASLIKCKTERQARVCYGFGCFLSKRFPCHDGCRLRASTLTSQASGQNKMHNIPVSNVMTAFLKSACGPAIKIQKACSTNGPPLPVMRGWDRPFLQRALEAKMMPCSLPVLPAGLPFRPLPVLRGWRSPCCRQALDNTDGPARTVQTTCSLRRSLA